MSVTFETLPPVSLHRLKIPHNFRKQVYSKQGEERVELLLTIFSRIAHNHNLLPLKAGTKKIHNFYFLVFHTQSKGKSLIAKQLEPLNSDTSLKSKAIDYLFFFIRALPYQKADIYAATRGGRIYQAIQNLTDYTFPHRVAKRFLSPTIRELKTSHLIGPVLNSSATYYSDPLFTQMELQAQFVVKFTTPVKVHSSLLCQFDSHPERMTYGVEVKMRSIRFNAEFSLEDYTVILAHLSKLYREEQTFRCPHADYEEKGTPEKDDNRFYFLDLVQRISYKKSLKLDAYLFSYLWDLYQNPTSMTHLRFWHRYSDDFLRSGIYALYLNGDTPNCEWASPPSVLEILESLSEIVKGKSKKQFIEMLEKSRFGFLQNGKMFKEKFSQFIDAEVTTEDGQIFFKNQGLWLKVSSEYLLLVQRDFRAHMRDCLIPRDHPAQLPLEWVSQKKWATFSFGELQGEIKQVTSNPLEVERIWGEIKKHAKPYDNGKKRKKIVSQSPEQKKRKMSVQTGIAGFLSQTPTSTSPLPDPKETFLFTESVRGLEGPIGAFLERKYQLQKEVRNEGSYNELYIGRKGFLVGDRITPQGIELFDLLKKDGEMLYLYQVKESLSETTTKACSQLRNAAKALSTTLMNPFASSNILEKFWEEAISPKNDSYFKKLKNSFERLGKESFLSLFNRYRKQICFVLAVLDTHANEALLSEEQRTKISLNERDLKELCKNTCFTEMDILQELQTRGYIDQHGGISQSLIFENKEIFSLGEGISKKVTNKVFYKIYRKITRFNSTLAKVDISLTRRIVEEMGFAFKVCQVFRPGQDPSPSLDSEEEEWSLPNLPTQSEINLSLSPGSSLCFNEQEYTIVSTPGDGSCGLHALWGEVDLKECRFSSDEDPKEFYIKKLGAALNDSQVEKLFTACQLDLLENALHSPDPSHESKMVYPNSRLQEFEAQLNTLRLNVEARKKRLLKEEGALWVVLLNTYPQIKNRVMGQALQKKGGFFIKFQETDIPKLMDFINGERDALYGQISNPEKLTPINTLFRQRVDNSAINGLKNDFVRERGVRQHYLDMIRQRDYYFSTQELKLAALLTNTKMIILREGIDSVNIADRYDPQTAEEEILIYHHFPDSQHFSRLALNNLKESI